MNSLWKRYGLFGLLTALAVGLGSSGRNGWLWRI